MNGKNLYEKFVYLNSHYDELSEFNTVEKLLQKEADGKTSIYRTPSQVFNDYLKTRFDISLSEFMVMYSQAHFKNIGFRVTDGIALPIGPTTICYFEETDDAIDLACKLACHASCIVSDSRGRTLLNLHENIYKFTLVRAKFDLQAEKDRFNFGYHFKTDRFLFFITSTVQFDLTVVYQEI